MHTESAANGINYTPVNVLPQSAYNANNVQGLFDAKPIQQPPLHHANTINVNQRFSVGMINIRPTPTTVDVGLAKKKGGRMQGTRDLKKREPSKKM